MSSRRIGSFVNLSPIQDISINPFSTLDSDSINKLTRIVSDEKDGVVFGLDVKSTKWDSQSIVSYNVVNDSQLQEFTDITKTQTETVLYRFDLSTFNLTNIIGKNVPVLFHLKFNLISGSPREITFGVNDIDNNSIKYPKHSGNDVKLDVIYNFANCKSSEVVLKIMFVLDPSDVYSSFKDQQVFYTGSSTIQFNNVKIDFEILNDKDETYLYKWVDNHMDYNYPTSYVHPSNKIYVTSGLAIKDDVVLDIKGYNKDQYPCLTLDLNDNKSWLRNNPFTNQDFVKGDRQQYGYIYNDPNRTLQLNRGDINVTNKLLDFKYDNGNITFNPTDEYELTEFDYELQFTIRQLNNAHEHRITISEQAINSVHPELYGTVGYIVYKPTNKIIKKITLDIDRENNKYNKYEFDVVDSDLKLGFGIINQDNIKIVSSVGPIKVSGNINEVNSDMIQWANVVMYYTYFKNPRPNKCYIGLIRDEDLNDPRYREDYVVLAKVRFISPNTVDLISYENRQQIYCKHDIARHIDYGGQLSVEERALWLNPDGELDVPTDTSDAITKLIRWIPAWLNRCQHLVDSIMYNDFGLFRDNEVVIWKWDPENEYGDLQSSGIIIDNSGSINPFKLAAWNKELNKIVVTNYVIDLDEPINTNQLLSIKYDDVDNCYKITNKNIDGKNGQIVFHTDGTDSELHCDWIMNNGITDTKENDNIYVCNTEKDLDECMTSLGFSFEDVYKNWLKFGFTCANGWSGKEIAGCEKRVPYQYGITSYPENPANKYDANGNIKPLSEAYGCTYWFYNSDYKSVIQPINTYDWTGFVSNEKYFDYDITVRLFAPPAGTTINYNGTGYRQNTSDNDMMSFVAAFVVDSDGYQHTISFDRCGGDQSYWRCTLDRSCFYNNDVNSQRVFINFDDAVRSEGGKCWYECGDGALVRVKREGNVFTAYTCKRVVDGVYDYNDPENGTIKLEENTMIKLDLDNMTIQKYGANPVSITDPVSVELLTLFKDKSIQFGYASCSQNLAMFELLNVPVQRTIVDSINKKVYKYNIREQQWEETNEDYMQVIGSGKFSYNHVTNKLFWNNGSEIVEILDRVYNKTHGDEGEVLYCDGNDDVDPHQIMDSYSDYEFSDKYCVVTSEEQLKYCKESSINFVDVFSKWYKFGHCQNYQYNKTFWNILTAQGPVGCTKADTNNGSNSQFYAVKHWFYNDKNGVIYHKDYGGGDCIATPKTIVMPVNAMEYTGFVSNKKYNKYDVTMRFYSSNADDDFNGIVAAFATDSNGIEHTLSFLRSPNITNKTLGGHNVPHHWTCMLDNRNYWEEYDKTYRISDENGTLTDITVTQKTLYHNDEVFKDEVSDDVLDETDVLKGKCRGFLNGTNCGWSKLGSINGGTLIRVIRNGNIFKATTTKFVENATLNDVNERNLKYEITVNLDNYTITSYNDGVLETVDISSSKDVLDLFKEESSFGFSSISQPMSQTQIYKFITFDRIILDFYNNKTWTYDGNDWIVMDSEPLTRVKAGTLYYNNVIKSKYWVDKDKNVSCIDGLISGDGSNYTLNISKTNTDGKIAVWNENTKELQKSDININDINPATIVTLPDYSKCEVINKNGTFTIDSTTYPNGAWLNYQCNKKTTNSNVNRTIKIGSYFIVQQMSNPYSAVHGPTGNSGMIPLAPSDTFVVSNFDFSGDDKDIIQIFGMK